jgi:hypothetical protein
MSMMKPNLRSSSGWLSRTENFSWNSHWGQGTRYAGSNIPGTLASVSRGSTNWRIWTMAVATPALVDVSGELVYPRDARSSSCARAICS